MLHSDIIYLACSGEKYDTMGRRWRFVEYSIQHIIRALPPSIIHIAYCQLYLKFVRTCVQIFGIICIYTIKYLKRKHQNQICELWWHISAITCQIIMMTCQIFMLTCQIFMLTCHLFPPKKSKHENVNMPS